MHSVVHVSPVQILNAESVPLLEDDASVGIAAEALLACQARGADCQTMLAMCERLLAVTERRMLEGENRMMADGDPNLAVQVRRNGDVLFMLGQQVRSSRRTAAALPKPFLLLVNSLVARSRAPRIEAA